MRDPYLYEDVDVLKNRGDIKDSALLRKAEADITNYSMSLLYKFDFEEYDFDTLCEIHKMIFGQLYDWAGELRTIQIVKSEVVLGGDIVRYAFPKEIKKRLNEVMKEIKKLKKVNNDDDFMFRLVRIIAEIWHIHPFREGNTRTVIVFAILLAKHFGYEPDHELFKDNASYVRNALVWCSQGIYSKYEYLERIFFDAILHKEVGKKEVMKNSETKYEKIGDYSVKDYVEQPHIYKK